MHKWLTFFNFTSTYQNYIFNVTHHISSTGQKGEKMHTPLWHDQPREKDVTKMDFGDVPLLSLKERDRRWNDLRMRMYIRNIDALLLYGNDAGYGRANSNFRYITHFCDAHGAWGIFPLKGDCLVMSGPRHMHLPYSRYKALQNWVTDIRPDLGMDNLIRELKERGLEKSRLAIVSCPASSVSSEIFPYAAMEKLKAGLPEAEFVDGNPMLVEMRLFKSEEELELLWKAAALARKKVDAMINGVQVGRTEADIYADMISSDIRNGGEPQMFILMATGNIYEEDAGYKCMLHGCSQPGSPTMRKLREGDLAICEFHSQYGGYMSGCEFSVFLGKKPPKELVETHAGCMEALEAAIATIKPGTTLREAWTAIRKPILDRGLDFLEVGFHGHGLTSPEFPNGCVYREEDARAALVGDFPFKENMIVCINIDVHNPNWRKDVGLMFGDMLHITKDGAQTMINIPHEFICNEV
jgi:Xaa-Pro aminopeptidase